MADKGMHTPNPTSLDPLLAISYENYQKSLAYRCFSHLAPLGCSFLLKGKLKKIEEKTAIKDLGACSPEKNLKFSLCNGLFSAFERILIKLFIPHSGSPSPNMMHFVRVFSIYAYLLQARSGSRKT